MLLTKIASLFKACINYFFPKHNEENGPSQLRIKIPRQKSFCYLCGNEIKFENNDYCPCFEPNEKSNRSHKSNGQ